MHALKQVKHAKADRKDTDAVKEAIGSNNFDGEAETAEPSRHVSRPSGTCDVPKQLNASSSWRLPGRRERTMH